VLRQGYKLQGYAIVGLRDGQPGDAPSSLTPSRLQPPCSRHRDSGPAMNPIRRRGSEQRLRAARGPWWRRKGAGLEFRQQLLTTADDALEQQDRKDGELVAHRLASIQFDRRGLAAAPPDYA
jgi:hypothetical protein